MPDLKAVSNVREQLSVTERYCDVASPPTWPDGRGAGLPPCAVKPEWRSGVC